MLETDGLVFAYDIMPDGTAVPAPDLNETPPEGVSFRWLHFDLTRPLIEEWANANIPPAAAQALVAKETRPRVEPHEDGIIVTLRGVNMNDGADPTDMVALRLWITRILIVTSRRRHIKAVEEMHRLLQSGHAPQSSAEFLTRLTEVLIERIENISLDLEEAAETIEDHVYDAGKDQIDELAPLRRQIIKLRRHLAPMASALERLSYLDNPVIPRRLRSRLLENANRALRSVEELGEVRERLTAVSDHLYLAQNEKLARNSYLLSVIAAVFVPLGFFTGLLGMNVAGIPYANHPHAFLYVAGGLVVIGGALYLILRRRSLM